MVKLVDTLDLAEQSFKTAHLGPGNESYQVDAPKTGKPKREIEWQSRAS